jgi:hypothetical protein
MRAYRPDSSGHRMEACLGCMLLVALGSLVAGCGSEPERSESATQSVTISSIGERLLSEPVSAAPSSDVEHSLLASRDYILAPATAGPGRAGASAAAPASEPVATVPDGAFVTYGSFTMRRFNGRHTAVLIQPRDLDAVGLARVRQMVDESDFVFETLRDLTNGVPANDGDLLRINIVDSACNGANGCAPIGSQGMDVSRWVLPGPDYIDTVTHEMLHNFDRFNSFIFNSAEPFHSWNTYWDHYVRAYLYKTAEGLNVGDQVEAVVRDLLFGYESWPGANWQMCIINRACTFNGWGDAAGMSIATEGAVPLRIAQLHGLPAMRGWMATLEGLITSRGLSPDGMSPEQKLDLMQESIGRTLRTNSSCYFDYWRWPVSGLVRGPLEQLYGVQNPNCQDNDRDGVTEIARDCNDASAAISPTFTETVNGVDNDCDRVIDDVLVPEGGGDFPNTADTARLIPNEVKIRGNLNTTSDSDHFRLHLAAPSMVRLSFNSLGTFDGNVWIEGVENARGWVWPGARRIIKVQLPAGDAHIVVDGNVVGPYELTVQRDYRYEFDRDSWPITFTPAPGSSVAGATNRYRLPVPSVPAGLRGTPGLLARYWISGFGMAGAVSAGGAAPFEWVAPEGTNPLALTYRVQFVAGSAPVYPVAATSQLSSLLGPRPWLGRDVGTVGAAGWFSRFGESDLTVAGAGADIGGTADAFQFTSQTVAGDAEIIARVVSLQPTNPEAKVGVMIRESTAANARNAMMAISGAGQLSFQRRTSTGGSAASTAAATVAPPYWVRVTRQGSTLTGYGSADGKLWTSIGTATLASLPSSVMAGIGVTSHDVTLTASAGVDHVIVRPLPAVLLVTGSATLTAADAAIRSRLESLGYVVVVRTGAAATASDATGKAVVVISSTASAASVGTKFRNLTVPVACAESSLFPNLGMTGPIAGTDFGTASDQSEIVISDATHPLAAGLFGAVYLVTMPATFSWALPNANATAVAMVFGNWGHAAEFGYSSGASMVGMVAPAKRVGLFLEDRTATVLTADGWALFDVAINWATAP